jgi:AcrR family transcriptional regulator
VIEDSGYGAASVVAIAERTGVASGTLYRHFTSKEEVFVEVFHSVCSGRSEPHVLRRWRCRRGERGGSARGGAEHVRRAGAPQSAAGLALVAEPIDRLVDAERLICRERCGSLVAEVLRVAIGGGEVPMQNVEFTAAGATRSLSVIRMLDGWRASELGVTQLYGLSGWIVSR